MTSLLGFNRENLLCARDDSNRAIVRAVFESAFYTLTRAWWWTADLLRWSAGYPEEGCGSLSREYAVQVLREVVSLVPGAAPADVDHLELQLDLARDIDWEAGVSWKDFSAFLDEVAEKAHRAAHCGEGDIGTGPVRFVGCYSCAACVLHAQQLVECGFKTALESNAADDCEAGRDFHARWLILPPQFNCRRNSAGGGTGCFATLQSWMRPSPPPSARPMLSRPRRTASAALTVPRSPSRAKSFASFSPRRRSERCAAATWLCLQPCLTRGT